MEDMVMACCFGPCVTCQLAREAHDRTGFT
jgi:hypothetical protein